MEVLKKHSLRSFFPFPNSVDQLLQVYVGLLSCRNAVLPKLFEKLN